MVCKAEDSHRDRTEQCTDTFIAKSVSIVMNS